VSGERPRTGRAAPARLPAAIRRANESDAPQILRLVEDVVAEVYGHLFGGERPPAPDGSEPWASGWVAEDRGSIVGVGLAPDDWLDDLWLARAYRGRGLGAALLACLEAQIAERGHAQAWLGVVAGNSAARRFYLDHGWQEVSTYPHERWGFEMVDMTKPLRP